MNGAASLLALALLASGPPDLRVVLVETQLAGEEERALRLAEEILATVPDQARPLGLDYLRGHLLERLERPLESVNALLLSVTTAPELSLHAFYRLAQEYERLGHPEMAAGLVAKVVSAGRSFAELEAAARLLRRTLGAGGDCRLLGTLQESRLPMAPRREIRLARIECLLREGKPAPARALVLALLNEGRGDEAALQAAELTAAELRPERDRELALAVGLTLHEHREFARSSALLDRAFEAEGPPPPVLAGSVFRSRYARARNDFWQGDLRAAAAAFAALAERTTDGERRADALFQSGRSLELAGDWTGASAGFRRAYLADPTGSWAGAGLLAALRLEWRSGLEAPALELFELLLRNRRAREHAARAALFLSASDLVRERPDRAELWLGQAERVGAPAQEIAYWRGRRARLAGDRAAAVAFYLEAVLADPHHPFAQLAAGHLREPELAGLAQAAGLRLSVSPQPRDLLAAWALLGDGHPRGHDSLRALAARLARDPAARPYLRLTAVPVAEWPLFRNHVTRAEDLLLALGLWGEGAPAAGRHFPLSDPRLAFTAAGHFAAGGELQRAVRILEVLEERRPAAIPHRLLPAAYRRLLYPLPYRSMLLESTSRYGVDPALLGAIIREESRFDPRALSSSSARGLTQFTQPTAQRFAVAIDRQEIGSEDLYQPRVSIALGAAYLGELGGIFGGLDPALVAAYNAGEDQARIWVSHCFSPDPAEYLSKIGFRQTRAYVGRVLTSRAHYREIYGQEIAGQGEGSGIRAPSP